MPRYRRDTTTAARRLGSTGRYFKYGAYNWRDPFPEIMGTVPEKRIYARLVLMNIPFEYQSSLRVNIAAISLVKDYRPDFILPDQKVVIEVQGSYWHSSAEAIEADSYKYALYEMMGYKVLTWWDYEIETDVDALIMRDLGLYIAKGYKKGGRVIDPKRQKEIDDLKGLRTMNARKRKPYRTFIGTGRKKLRKVKSSYGTR